MRCLIVIDVQNGFVSNITKHVVPEILDLMDCFQEDLIIATQFVNAPNSGFTDIMHWDRLKTAPETDIIKEIQEKAHFIAVKNTYSSCTSEVMELLHKNNITEVYLAGIDTDCCVMTTAISLFEMNIRPVVMADYCASNGGIEGHRAALTVLKRTIGQAQIFMGHLSNGGELTCVD